MDLLSDEVVSVLGAVAAALPRASDALSASHVSGGLATAGLATAEHALSVAKHVEALLPALSQLSQAHMHSHMHTSVEEVDTILDTAADRACASIRKAVVVLRLKEQQEKQVKGVELTNFSRRPNHPFLQRNAQ